MTNENEREGLIPISGVAALTGVSRDTVERWVRAGRVAVVKFPLDRRTYVRLADIEHEMATPPVTRPGGWRKRWGEEAGGDG